ncbi:hypothetical protein BH10PSE17_BH10PSE17_33220 [soil metagenome]
MSSIGSPREYFADHPVSGPAYPAFHKASATAILIGIVFYGFRGLESSGNLLTLEMKFGLALIGLVLLFSYRALMRSTTMIDADGVAQTSMGKRTCGWSDILGVRVTRQPFGARMAVRTRNGRITIYHAANEELSAAFALMSRHYPPA